MLINSKMYDILKPIALVWLPLLGTIYFAVAGFWGLPDATEVVGTITAVDTALGGLLGISSSQYKAPAPEQKIDGKMVVDPVGGTLQMELTADPGAMALLKAGELVTFKVEPKT